MADDNVYIGKMDNKKQKSIGVCRPTSGMPNIALGGVDCTTYDIKPVSCLCIGTRVRVSQRWKPTNYLRNLKV